MNTEDYEIIKKTVYYMKINENILFSYEDLIQDGYIAYVNAKKTYDNNKNCSFKTYLVNKIRWNIIDKIRKHNNYKYKHNIDIVYMNENYNNPYIDKNIENIENKIFINNLITCLSIRERKILMMIYYKNMKFKNVGKKLNVNESRISQLNKEILTKLRIKASAI